MEFVENLIKMSKIICPECKKEFKSLGFASHRVMHYRWRNAPVTKTGYSCPNCGTICTEKTMISMTKPRLMGIEQESYSWLETHRCQKCKKLYCIPNGT